MTALKMKTYKLFASILLISSLTVLAEEKIQSFTLNGESGQIYANQGKKEVIGNAIAKTDGLIIRSHRITEIVNQQERTIEAKGNQQEPTKVQFTSPQQKVDIIANKILLNVTSRTIEITTNVQLTLDLLEKMQRVQFKGEQLQVSYDENNQLSGFSITGTANEIQVITQDKGKLNAVADSIEYNLEQQTLDLTNAIVELGSDKFEAAQIHVDIEQMLLNAPKQQGKRIKFTRELDDTETETKK